MRSGLTEPPDASLRRLYYDTVTHDADLLRALVDYAGADHVLLGSDRPFDMGTADPVGEVRALGLDAGAERAVLGGNAAALLGLGEVEAAG
jgi:aminocarboxymuconate-semialdehyde decarboxylase